MLNTCDKSTGENGMKSRRRQIVCVTDDNKIVEGNRHKQKM
jgi:hypothetical protein